MSLIRNINPSDRPREKLIREGVESLSNEELLALLIGSGTKNNSALDISKELLERYGGLNNLLNAVNSGVVTCALTTRSAGFGAMVPSQWSSSPNSFRPRT